MIRYPDGRKTTYQSPRSSSSNRGMTLESDINVTNERYLEEKKAVVHKKPTPIQIVTVDYPKRSAAKITEAYFKVPSTTDYNGVSQGKALDFEAKECASKTSFPLSSIHPHQIHHLEAVLKQGAIAFVIIRFTSLEETYYVDAEKITSFWENPTRKSIPYSWFQENGILIPYQLHHPVDYLPIALGEK